MFLIDSKSSEKFYPFMFCLLSSIVSHTHTHTQSINLCEIFVFSFQCLNQLQLRFSWFLFVYWSDYCSPSPHVYNYFYYMSNIVYKWNKNSPEDTFHKRGSTFPVVDRMMAANSNPIKNWSQSGDVSKSS